MTETLYDAPFWMPIALIGTGVFALLSGNRRQDAKLRNIGLAVASGGIVLFLLSHFVDTNREKAQKRTRQLVQAVDTQDWSALRALLDAKASMQVVSANVYSNREQIVAAAKIATEQYGLKNIRILSMSSREDGSLITVDLDALSDQGLTGQAFPTGWQFEWQELSAGWTLMRITCLRIGNDSGEATRGHFPRP